MQFQVLCQSNKAIIIDYKISQRHVLNDIVLEGFLCVRLSPLSDATSEIGHFLLTPMEDCLREVTHV